MTDLRPFQRRFVRAVDDRAIDTCALSLPRGNGKSWLAGHILTRALTPDDPLFVAGTESVIAAASLEQGRIVFRFVREVLEPTGAYRFLDSNTRIGIVHKATNTRLRVIGSNGKTAMGLVRCPLVVADEPGAWEVRGGELLSDAILTAQGKPESRLKAVFIGTLAPAMSGWWHQMVEGGSRGSTYVQALQGDPKKWKDWREIQRVNPLSKVSADFRRKLREERDTAKADTRLKARFLSYRLNVPSADESTMLLDVSDWERVCARPVPERAGRHILAVDLGAGRAWSAAVAVWRSGRVEAVACAPGIPSIANQERRDRVPTGTYQRLVDGGVLTIADGLRVQPPAALIATARERWGSPEAIVCDRFRLAELKDCVNGTRVIPRVSRWSEAAADIRALRKLSKDGPLACEESSRPLLTASLSGALVKSDDQGNTRLVKAGTNNTARDDVAAALVLGAGLLTRAPKPRTGVYLGTA